MLDAIAAIGKLTLHSEPERLIRGLVRKQAMRDKEAHYYAELHFSTNGKPFEVTVKQYAMSDPFETPLKLHYVGVVPAAGLQFHVTGHDLRHLCSQVLPALVDKLSAASPFAATIRNVLEHHFVLDENNPKDRYRYLLHAESLATVQPGSTQDLIKKEAPKNRPAAVAKAIQAYIEQRFFVKPDHVLLYTICIDGELVSDHPEYIQAVLDDQVSMFAKASEDICYLTGRRELVSPDLTKFKFKYYITDKINFSHKFSGKFENSFQLSRPAVWQVLLGERYVMNHLRQRFGGFRAYLIPEFLDYGAYEHSNMERMVQRASRAVEDLSVLKRVEEMERTWSEDQQNIADFAELDTRMLLHFLFYEENKSEMKVHLHIKDVLPSRLALMERKREQAVKDFRAVAPYYRCMGPSFEGLYYYLPLELDSKNKVKNPRQLMQLYDSMLSGRSIELAELVRLFTKVLSELQHGAFGAKPIRSSKKVQSGDEGEALWCRINWEQQQYIRWLMYTGHIERGEEAVSIEEITDRLAKEREHMLKSGFTTTQAALFLLGCAINKIADAQEIELKSRAIMRKINFRGMDMISVQKLATEVFEKGLQYKNTMKKHHFLTLFERYYQEMSRLLDLSFITEQNKTLGKSEVVYYIVSGYSYANALKATKRSTESAVPGDADADTEVDNDSEEENQDE